MRRILETRSWSASPQSLRRLADLSGTHIQPCEGLEGDLQQPAQISEGQTVPDQLDCFLRGDAWLHGQREGAVNIPYLNLSKAFSTVSCSILIVSLERCRLAN